MAKRRGPGKAFWPAIGFHFSIVATRPQARETREIKLQMQRIWRNSAALPAVKPWGPPASAGQRA
ncbi:MAG: hypothetical protein ACK44Y_13335, partial [Novosphingobium sp.]